MKFKDLVGESKSDIRGRVETKLKKDVRSHAVLPHVTRKMIR